MYHPTKLSYPAGMEPRPEPPNVDIAEAFAEHYPAAAELTARCIENGAFPEAYELPPAETFAYEVDILRPFHDGLRGYEMLPRVALVPQGLSVAAWNQVLSGLSLKTAWNKERAALSQGVARYHAEGFELPEAATGSSKWDVAVMSTTIHPTFLVPADGSGCHGSSKDHANTEFLRKLPGIAEPQAEDLSKHIRRISPAFATYAAVQLHAMAGEVYGPLDIGSATLLKERVTENGEQFALYAGWTGSLQMVDCVWLGMDEALRIPLTGVRPALAASELSR